MARKDNVQIFVNLIWGVISGSLTFLLNFFVTPIITNRLGIEAYGFVSLGNTLTGYIGIISAGVNAFADRYIAVSYHNERVEEANQFYNSVLGANMILSACVMVPGIFIIQRLEHFLSIPQELLGDVKILFVLIIINYLMSLITGVFSSVTFIKNKASVTYRTNSISKVATAGLVLGAFYAIGVKVYYVAAANFAGALFCLIASYHYSRKFAPELSISVKYFSFSKIRTLIVAGTYNVINSLGGTLGSGLDLLITNLYLSNVVMGWIGVGKQLGGMLTLAISLVSSLLRPKQLEAYSLNDKPALVNALKGSMELCSVCANVFWCCFLFLGMPFLRLWLPAEDHWQIFVISVIVIIDNLMTSIVTPLYYVATLTVRMKAVCAVTLGCGAANVLSMLVLLKYTALPGAYVVVGTTTVLNISALVVFPKLARTYLNLENNPFIGTIVKHFAVSAVIAVLCLITPVSIQCTSWIQLIGWGVVLGCVSLLACSMVLLNPDTRRSAFEIVHRKMNRSRKNRG